MAEVMDGAALNERGVDAADLVDEMPTPE